MKSLFITSSATLTCCKHDVQADTSFWQHSSQAMASRSLKFLSLCAAATFFKSHQRFSMAFKSGDSHGLLLKTSLGGLWGSLAYWKVQWQPSLNYLANATMFSLGFHLALPDTAGFQCLRCTGLKSSSFASSLHKTESLNCLFRWFWAYWSLLLLCFSVSIDVHLGVQAWSSSVFILHLTLQTETSVPATTRSCCKSVAVTQGFLTTYLLWTLVTVVNSFLFLTCPGSVTTFPLILKV